MNDDEGRILGPMGFTDDDEVPIDGVGFAREGSALRAASRRNPRNLDCPTCGAEDVLTPLDARRGYQCDRCADRDEGGLL